MVEEFVNDYLAATPETESGAARRSWWCDLGTLPAEESGLDRFKGWMGMILYKYATPDRIDDLIEERFLRFTQPEVFNDPFESLPAVESVVESDSLPSHVASGIDERVNTADWRQQFSIDVRNLAAQQGLDPSADELRQIETLLERMIRSAAQGAIADRLAFMNPRDRVRYGDEMRAFLGTLVGVLCLSEVADSILMWSHYANHHTGFVLGFDAEHPFFTESAMGNYSSVMKVEYAEVRPSFAGFDMTSLKSSAHQFLAIALFVKSYAWAYEREWRLARRLEGADRIISNQVPPIYLFRYPFEALRNVVLGCRMLDADRAIILKLIRTTVPHVQVLQAELDLAQYRLNLMPLKAE